MFVCGSNGKAQVTFIDNDYFNYNHVNHANFVRRYPPKYATVMDVMTKLQCEKDNVKHYELAQILDWAEELNQYAENVIVIPKYDCLDLIPEKFMLGYSVPTSHGGTPLPPEMFKGRRVHLLGGSWKAQLAHMAILGDDVVSADNNYISLGAQMGDMYLKDGERKKLNDHFGIDYLTNVHDCALALSLGAMGAKVKELYGDNDAV